MFLESPSGPVPLNSPFYVERPPMEQLAYTEITKPGSVIRIRAPQKMGKNSLLNRITAHSQTLGYQTVSLDFLEAEKSVFTSLNKFLRWFCFNLTRLLGIEPMLDNCWDEEMGVKVSCSIYLTTYILEQIHPALVLALNEVNLLFEYPVIAQDFFPLLRYWHEQAKQVQSFQKLRLVVVHSTEVYIPLDINQSPFNVGVPINLPLFTYPQVQDLVERHGFNWHNTSKTNQLIAMIGGHPYLLRLALYYLSSQEITLEQLLTSAPTVAGIYSEYLSYILAKLLEKPTLVASFKKVINSDSGTYLDPLIIYKLDSMGLIKIEAERVMPSCELYRLYFKSYFQSQTRLEVEANPSLIEQLKSENEQLQKLVNIDSTTQIFNRRYFDEYIEKEWRRMTREAQPLSLIMLDIDYFKAYNDTYGHQAGDNCLRQVAQAIKLVLQRPADFVARYGGEEFVVILPQIDADGAVFIAEKIRSQIKALAIEHINSQVSLKILTISLGVASMIPTPEADYPTLIEAADVALYQSKKQSRDCVILSDSFNYRFGVGSRE